MKFRLMVVALYGLGVLGCGSRASSSEPARTQRLCEIREVLQQADRDALVGRVVAVLPDLPFAAVGDIPVERFQRGEPITFIDANRKRLTNGIVRNMSDTRLHVEFDKPPRNGRAPRVGDLAVRFKK